MGLVACAPNNTPTSYDEVAASSFEQSCTGDAPEYNGTSTTLAGSDYCVCAYQCSSRTSRSTRRTRTPGATSNGQLVFANYSGKTYVEYNTELRNDPNILAADVVDKLNACKADPEVVLTPSGSTPATSAPGTTAPLQ